MERMLGKLILLHIPEKEDWSLSFFFTVIVMSLFGAGYLAVFHNVNFLLTFYLSYMALIRVPPMLIKAEKVLKRLGGFIQFCIEATAPRKRKPKNRLEDVPEDDEFFEEDPDGGLRKRKTKSK